FPRAPRLGYRQSTPLVTRGERRVASGRPPPTPHVGRRTDDSTRSPHARTAPPPPHRPGRRSGRPSAGSAHRRRRARRRPGTGAPRAAGPEPRPAVTPGEPWRDTSGEVIQAHGGQVLVGEDADGPLYHWYGEDRTNGYGSSPGVHVYSSRDLYSWTDEGLALRALATAEELETDPYFTALYGECTEEQKAAVVRDLLTTAPPGSSAPAAILERPKVLHNAAKGTWVMWVHADGPSETSDAQYAKARAGVA